MNKVIQTVTLVADPETTEYGTEGKLSARFRGAVNKRYRKDGEPDADFFMYSAFGKTAEFIKKFCEKGKKFLVEGELVNNNYEKDGVKHYGVKIIIDRIEFWGKKDDGEITPKSTETSAPATDNTKSSSEPPAPSSYDEFDDF